MRPGTGGSRYVEYGSNPFGGAQGKGGQARGVDGSVVPPRARSIGGPEPQSAVDPKTFQKGQRIFQKAFDPKYASTPTAQKIRQQATQAGFGDSPNIPASELPTIQPSMKPGGKSFNSFAQKALGTAGALGAAELIAPQPAEPNVSKSDLNKRIADRLPGYTIGEFDQQGKGDHVTAPILDPQGKPVINPRTGKPVTIGGGVRGKNELSNSALGTLTNAINQIKSGGADTTGQAKGSKKVDVSTDKPVTRGRKQPKPTRRTTIKSMPANMLGKPPRFPMKFSHDLEGQMLAENRSRILREIKKETILPDERKEKLTGYRPKTYGKIHTQYDKLMQKAENPASFKQMDETAWTKNDKYYNERLSQEHLEI